MSESFRWDLAKDGDPVEVERIVEKYYRVAYKIAHWWAKSGKIEESEALGLANIAIMKCINKGTYDESRGVKFSSYLGSAVHNEIRMFLRKDRKMKERTCFSLDQPLMNADGDTDSITYGDTMTNDITLEDEFNDKYMLEDALEILHDASDEMTDVEIHCINLHLNGLSIKEISGRLGFSQSYIRKVFISFQDKLKEHRYKMDFS